MLKPQPLNISDWNLPRSISVGLKMQILFGNVVFSMGLLFFLFGSVFTIVFGLNADFTSPFSFNDNDPSIKGIVVKVEETGSRENKRSIYQNTVKYKVNGKEYYSDSYSLGNVVNALDSVDVQYSPEDVSLSRISGMRKAPFSAWVVLLTLIFPGIGLTMLIFGIRRSRINVRLLKIGLLTHGKVTRKEATNTKINKQTVYKVFFTFTTKNGILTESSVKTHKTHLLEDEEKEQLVYDAENPTNAVLIDSLPKAVRSFLAAS